MKINILQTDIHWGNPIDNMQSAERLMDSAPEADLCVLPEMWNTGFMTDGRPPRHDEALEWMIAQARQRRCAVCGSMAVTDDDNQLCNRLHFVWPDGSVACYDKRHLFSYGGEDKLFHKGTERTIVSFQGMRLLLAVCYDLRFPVWLRNRGDYDAMVIVANWPESRRRVWDVLLQARALENQCYVVAANRVGNDPTSHYSGGSYIIDAKGRLLASDNGSEEVVSGLIEQEPLAMFREKFPVMRDGDDFKLNI